MGFKFQVSGFKFQVSGFSVRISDSTHPDTCSFINATFFIFFAAAAGTRLIAPDFLFTDVWLCSTFTRLSNRRYSRSPGPILSLLIYLIHLLNFFKSDYLIGNLILIFRLAKQ